MTFSSQRISRLLSSAVILLLSIASSACHRISNEEKALRLEAREALRTQAYPKAAALAQRSLEFSPRDEGNWNRRVQAQFGQRDAKAVHRCLAGWRNAIIRRSARLEEYTGDLALEEHDPALARQAWLKAISIDEKNVRLHEKIARLEHGEHNWAEENKAWTAYLHRRENATARLNRALCRRHLQQWEEAFADLRRAQQLAPNDAEVDGAAKLFARLEKLLPQIRELNARFVLSPEDFGLLGDRALIFLRCKDPELALEDGEAAANLAPWAVRPKLFAAISLIDLGRAPECDKLSVLPSICLDFLTPELIETIARLDSEISVEQSNADLYVTRAWQLNEINQPGLSLQDAEAAMRLDPKSASGCAESSYALMKLGRGEEAFERIKQATEIDPNYATGWQYRGELEMARSDFVGAIESLTRALAVNQTATALEKREECYRRIGLSVKAEQDHRALEQLNAPAIK
ncbi:MAG: hypothetical protein ACR2MF_00180 [Chthoniobacterales bacterium]